MQLIRNLSTYRNPIKGIAILWVCFFHAKLGLEQVPVLGALQQIGYLGVDLFMLLSGMGLYHSLDRNPSLPGYLKRRAQRLLPAFWPVCLLWCLTMIPGLQLTGWPAWHSALGSLTLLGHLTGAPYTLNWYLSLLLTTILLAPAAHALLRRAKRPILATKGLVALAGLCGVLFIGRDQLMLVSRLPLFLLGMGLMAIPTKESDRRVITGLLWLGFLIGAGMLYLAFTRYAHLLIRWGLYWYPALLMIPGLAAGLGWAMDKLAKKGVRWRVLDALGKASFEIFLFNGWFELYCKQVLKATEPLTYLLWMLLSIGLGLLWHGLVGWMSQRLKRSQNE